MRTLKDQILSGMVGAAGGLAGVVPFSRCGGNCAACFGCVGVGLGIVLIVIGRKIMRGKEGSDGMV